MIKAMAALKVPSNSVYYYSDSMIVLSWIQRSPEELKTFVATRASTIQSFTDIKHWKNVWQSDNLADVIFQGRKPQNLLHNNLWWIGPQPSDKDDDFVPNFSKPGEMQSDGDRHFYQESHKNC